LANLLSSLAVLNNLYSSKRILQITLICYAPVEYLRGELTRVASEVDEICSDGKQLTISKDGEPVLKRLKSPPEPNEVEELEEKIRALMPERSI